MYNQTLFIEFMACPFQWQARFHTTHTPLHPNLSAKPAPTSSLSLSAKMPLKSNPSPLILGASPLLGALGLAALLLFSCPALLGNVGNIASALGRGSSLNQGCVSTSLALGRWAGLRDRRELRRSVPAPVRSGNLERITEPTACGLRGRRRPLALGRRRNPGQVSSEGRPQSSKI